MKHLVRALIGVMLIVPAALAQAPIELPFKESLSSERDYRKLEYEYRRLNSVEAYERTTKDRGETREKGKAFLEASVRHLSRTEGRPDEKVVLTLGEAAREAGSQDPLVLLHYVEHRRGYRTSFGAAKIYREIHPKIIEGDYSPWIKLRTTVLALPWIGLDTFVEEYAATLADPLLAQRPEFRRPVYRLLTDAMTPQRRSHYEKIVEYLEEPSEIDPALLSLIRGRLHITLAIRRNEPPAFQEPELAFRKHLQAAREDLLAARQLEPTWPEPSTEMIAVAGYRVDEESPQTWFERALACQWDYVQSYQNIVYAFESREGGGEEQRIELAKACIATERYDTEVPLKGMDILEAFDHAATTDHEFLATPQAYELMKKAIVGSVRDCDREDSARTLEEKRRLLAKMAALAVLAQQWSDARQFVDQYLAIATDEDQQHYFEYGRTLAEVKTLAFAHTSRAATIFRETQDLLSNHQLDAAAEALARVEREDLENESTRLMHRHLELTIAWEQGVRTGDWVPLTFEPGMPGWNGGFQAFEANMKFEPDGSLLVDPKRAAGLQFQTKADFGQRFEFVGTIVPLNPGAKSHSGSTVGLSVGNHLRRMGVQQWTRHSRQFWIHDGAQWKFGAHRDFFPLDVSHAGWVGPRQIRIFVWDGRVLGAVGEELVPVPQDPPIVTGAVGFGCVTSGAIASKMRFKDFRVRRLDAEVPTDPNDPAQLQRFLSKLVTASPNDLWAVDQRMKAAYTAGDYIYALRDAEHILQLDPGHLDAGRYRVRSLRQLGSTERASIEAKALLAKNPMNFKTLWDLVEMTEAAGDRATADKLIEDAVKLSKQGRIICGLATLHFAEHNPTRAKQLAKIAIEKKPNQWESLAALAIGMRKLRMPDADKWAAESLRYVPPIQRPQLQSELREQGFDVERLSNQIGLR